MPSHDPAAAISDFEKVCDAASERALEASAALMREFDNANRARELLGSMASVQEAGEYRMLKRTLDARATAFIEAANIVEHHFGVSRHEEVEQDAAS